MQTKKVRAVDQAGEALPEDERTLAEAMRMHPELDTLWDDPTAGLETDYPPDGVNPWMHVQIHSVVKNQRELLPDVEAAIQRLCDNGLSEHEAEHRVGELVARLIYSVLKEKKPYDEKAYLADVRALR